MASFKLTVYSDNESTETELREELAEILRQLADHLVQRNDLGTLATITTGKYQNVHNLNGEPVGTWRLLLDD